MNEEYPGITVMISISDKERIERLRIMRINPGKRKNRRETAGEVIHRALNALEEKGE